MRRDSYRPLHFYVAERQTRQGMVVGEALYLYNVATRRRYICIYSSCFQIISSCPILALFNLCSPRIFTTSLVHRSGTSALSWTPEKNESPTVFLWRLYSETRVMSLIVVYVQFCTLAKQLRHLCAEVQTRGALFLSDWLHSNSLLTLEGNEELPCVENRILLIPYSRNSGKCELVTCL